MNQNNKLRGIDFYIAASCNLNCNYCTISKNKSLHKIDDIIKKSLYEDDYLNLAKKLWKDRENELECIDLWGGEPTIGLPWFIDNMDKFFLYFINLKEVFLSTNLVYHDGLQNLQDFITALGRYNRNIKFTLQVSIDGPPEVNDLSRGNGVTANFLINFKKLFELSIPDKVKLEINMKPTLSNTTLTLLDTKEKIINYYQFFDDNLFIPYILSKNKKHIKFNTSTPNFAQPGTYTTEDGKLFSEFIKNSIEITKENQSNGYFNGFDNIVLFSNRYECSTCDAMQGGFCGAMLYRVSLLPNNQLTICHRAFTDTLDEYVNEYFTDASLKDKPIFTDINIKDKHNIIKMDLQDFDKVSSRISYFYNNRHRHLISVMKSMIPLLLEAKQISDIYKDDKLSEEAINFVLSSCTCIYDNIVLNGSLTVPTINNIKLFLNGAAEQIIAFKKGNQKC